MNKRNDILVILSPGFAVNEADSTCLPSQQLLVRALNRNYPGLKIIILAFEYPFTRSTYAWYGSTVIPFDGSNKNKKTKLTVYLSIWSALHRLQQENHVIGLFSFWCTNCALIGKYFGKLYRIRHFIWILGQDARKDNRFIPFIRPRAGELVAMSDALVKEFYGNHGVRPAHIIPNAVEPALFDTGGVERDIDILGAGSLIPLKRFDLFIDIIGVMVSRQPAIRAVICGKGPEEDNLQKKIRDLQLEQNISLVGERPHSELLQLMRRSKILLHPSSYEGYSTVCLEALYAGAHVLSFCHPGSEWVRHWRIAENLGDMAEQALEILQDPQTGYQPVLVNSMDDTAKAVMDLFGDGLAKSPGTDGNISFYDAIAGDYDDILGKEESNRVVRQKVASVFTDTVKEGWVLDFGGGTGQDMEWLSSHQRGVIFCEPSGGMRDKAIRHSKELPNGDKIIFLDDARADFTGWRKEMPFDRKVDAVLSNFAVINSIRDIGLMFSNLSLVIKPEGHFFALVLKDRRDGASVARVYRAMRSLILPKAFAMQVAYKEHRQSVYLHPETTIRRAAANWFDFCGSESFEGTGFSLIHLKRK